MSRYCTKKREVVAEIKSNLIVAIISADNKCALPEAKTVPCIRSIKVKIVAAGRRRIQVATKSKPERRERGPVGKYFFTPQSGIGLM